MVLADTVVLGVMDPVPLPVLLDEGVGVPVPLLLPVELELAPLDKEVVGLAEIVEVPLLEGVLVGDGVPDTVGFTTATAAALLEEVEVAVGVREGVGDGVLEGSGSVGVDETLAPGLDVEEGEGDLEEEGLGVEVLEEEGLGVGV